MKMAHNTENEEIKEEVDCQQETPECEVSIASEEQTLLALAEMEDKYKRVLAEYQNFRTRSQKEREGFYQDTVASTVMAFLPVIDTLERAYAQESNEEYKATITLIIKQYNESLERFNVKPFGERGDEFDPNIHNAVMHVEDEELGQNTVAEVLLKGYKMGDRVVRHALVKAAN